jgi:hypothetical protein
MTPAFTNNTYKIFFAVAGLIAASVFTVPAVVCADEAHVSNNVSVSSSGETSSASIKTTINGVTVEDEHIKQPGTISTHVDTNTDGTTVISSSSIAVGTSTSSMTDGELKKRISELITLIRYYVSLLQHAQ